jgi:hypothetical protein
MGSMLPMLPCCPRDPAQGARAPEKLMAQGAHRTKEPTGNTGNTILEIKKSPPKLAFCSQTLYKDKKKFFSESTRENEEITGYFANFQNNYSIFRLQNVEKKQVLNSH